jgi:probable F420-dependent oxidoreductase
VVKQALQYGVLLPTDEVRFGTSDLDEWAATAEESGYHHIVAGDHVVGVDPSQAAEGWDRQWPGRSGGSSAYTVENVFREPLVLLGYLAARTRIGLVTGILISPQRQTVLLAKQAAELDLLSAGRLRLCVGVGWNPIEYEALGVDFASRGHIMEEQCELLRLLWSESIVSYSGQFHQVRGSGLQELPAQRPIPLWMGGGQVTRVLERVGRLADGWFVTTSSGPSAELQESIKVIRGAAESAGRDPDSLGVEGRLVVGARTDDELLVLRDQWAAHGATHICIDTRFGGRSTPGEHIEAVRHVSKLILS